MLAPSRHLSSARIRIALAAAGLLLFTSGASSAPLDLFLESNTDLSSGAEIFHVSYPSIGALQGNAASSFGFSVFDVGSTFDLVGMANDGSAYHVFLESNDDRSSGQEIYHARFGTLDDFLTGGILTASPRGFSVFDVGPAFDMAGVAHDGSSFHVFLESNDDRSSGQEIYHARFDTLDDFLTGGILTASPRGFSVFDVGPTFDLVGVAHDGAAFHVLLESNTDKDAGQELFHARFDTLDDLLTGGILTSPDRGFTSVNVNASFDVAGFSAVPEPGTLFLLGSGLLGLGWLGRRRNGSAPGSVVLSFRA